MPCCQLPASGWVDKGLVLYHSRLRLGQKREHKRRAITPIRIHAAGVRPPTLRARVGSPRLAARVASGLNVLKTISPTSGPARRFRRIGRSGMRSEGRPPPTPHYDPAANPVRANG